MRQRTPALGVRGAALRGGMAALAIVVLAALAVLAPVARASDIIEVNPPLQKLAEEQAEKLAGHLGPLSLHLVAGYASDPSEVKNLTTTTLGKENGHFTLNGPICQIAANHSWWDARTHYEMEEVLVHEDFHCYEHQIAPDAWSVVHHSLKEEVIRGIHKGELGDEGQKEEADWIIEGLARWVDLTLYPASGEEGLKNLTEYYETPKKPLFTRSYDAVGFWAHLQDISGDLWQRIPDILRAGVNFANQKAADAALGSDEETVLSSWGSSAFDLPAGEVPKWLMSSPLGGRYWPEHGPPPAHQTVDGTYGVALAPYTTAQLEIEPRADKPLIRIHFDPDAYGSFGVGQNYSGHELEGKTFCAPDECKSPATECPSGDTSKVPPLTPLPDQPYLGVAAGKDSSTVQITYTSPRGSGECEPPAPPPGSSSGSGATASSFGDPHLTAFGGFGLEFQAAGEFTLLKSTNHHDLEVQARQQPEFDDYFTVDTAVAMRVGGAIVEVDRPVGSFGPPTVLVNHHLTHAAHLKLRGGGSFERIDLEGASAGGLDSHGRKLPGVRVRWPDGTYVEVPENAVGISLLMKVAPARQGHLGGLLGDAGVRGIDEFHGREGRPFSPTLLEGNEAALDRKYGTSWRIKQRESLFTYASHKNTGSYTILDFPKKLFSDGTVPLAKALHAEALCRKAGSTNLRLLADCEYDILATGNDGYAEADGIVQTVSEAGPPAASNTPAPAGGGSPPGVTPAPAPSPPPAIDLGAGEAPPSIAYDPTSGYTYAAWQDPVSDDAIDLCVVPSGATVCNGGSGPYKLTDPTGTSGPNSPTFFGSKVLVMPGGTVVVAANDDGGSESLRSPGYESTDGLIVWSSPAGGAAFGKAGQGLANGGKLLAEGRGEMPNQGALALNATSILTYGNQFPFGSGATDFTLTAPAPKTTPAVDLLEEFGDNGAVSQLAAVEASPGKYLVVTAGNDAGTPKECPGGAEEGTGYGWAIGTPAELQKQPAWSHDFKALACTAVGAVLTGGGPGHAAIGAVDSEGPGLNGGGEDGIYFRAFDTPSHTFGGGVPISQEGPYTLDGADEITASEDSAGGLDACWIDARGVMLAHSSDGGASWQAPSITGIEGVDVVVAGTSPGQASIAYTANPGGGSQEYLAPSL